MAAAGFNFPSLTRATAARKPLRPVGPYAQLAPGQINQQVSRYVNALPAPMSGPQIQHTAAGELDPTLARIRQSIALRSRGAAQAIRGYTGSLADSLAGEDYSAPYHDAEAKQAAVDSALAEALSGRGLDLAAGLEHRLGAIGEPGVTGGAASAVAAGGAAAGNTELARGSSNIGALLASEASARSYGQKLPGIARLAGLQQLSASEAAAQQSLADQTAQVESQLPGIVGTLRGQSQTAATNRATQGESLRERLLARNDQHTAALTAHTDRATSARLDRAKTALAVVLANGVDPATGTLTPAAQAQAEKLVAQIGGVNGDAGLTGVSDTTAASIANSKRSAAAHAADRTARANQPKIIGSSRTGYYSYNPANGEKTLLVKPSKNASSTRPIIVGSDKAGRFALDPTTGKLTKLTGPVAGSKGKGGISATSYAVNKQKGLKALDLMYWGDEKKGIPAIDYGDAVERLVVGFSLTPQDAVALANRLYAVPGEAGRPNIGHDFTGHLTSDAFGNSSRQGR
jgi:hypothetical protein